MSFSGTTNKQRIASELIVSLMRERKGVLSIQVLNEYTNVALNKLKLSPTRIRDQLRFNHQFETVLVTQEISDKALDLHQTRSLSVYDALIVSAALVSGCSTLIMEDMSHRQIIEGLKISDPFS